MESHAVSNRWAIRRREAKADSDISEGWMVSTVKMGPRWGPYVLICSQPKRYLDDR